MVNKMLRLYKSNCTKAGQFCIVLNTTVMISSIVFFTVLIISFSREAIAKLLATYLFEIMKDNPTMTETIYTVYYLACFCIAECGYLVLCQIHIFYKMKKHIRKKIKKVIVNETNEEIKSRALDAIKKLQSYKLNQIFKKYELLKSIFNRMKLDEFLFLSEINSDTVVNERINDIKNYVVDNKNFKEIINYAALVASVGVVGKPVVDYLQVTCIPNTASDFNYINLLIYLGVIGVILFVLMLIEILIKKINDGKIQQEKEILLEITSRLSQVDFSKNKLERYIELIEQDND